MSEAEYVEMLLEQQVSGMVFAGGQYAQADAPHEHYARLLKLRLPVVLVNAAAEHLEFPRVSTDDAVAMEQAYAPPRLPGPHADRPRPRPAGPRPLAAQARRVRGVRPRDDGQRARRASSSSARCFSLEGGAGRRGPADRARA